VNAFQLWLAVFAGACTLGVAGSLVLAARLVTLVVASFGALAGGALIGLGVESLAATTATTLVGWTIPSLGQVLLRSDALSGVFLVVTGLVFIAVSIYSVSALRRLAERYSLRTYAVMYFVLLASIAWILVAADVFSFLVAWEIMSILVYFLVIFEHESAEARSASYVMLGISEAGALSAALGLLVLASRAGSLDFVQLEAAGKTLGSGAGLAVFLLTFVGFGVKAGLVPVNVWLPRAYTAAPAAFVPLLAGATLNLGLYGIFRVNAVLAPPVTAAPGLIALIVGTISALVGILYATTDNDLKTLLAHSSIENAGIITAAFGAALVFTAAAKPALAAMALVVALYHLANHSLYKTLLFVGAGAVDDGAGTRDLDQLGGLARRMPWTAAGVLAGVLSIAALPPFNGFVSEWLTLQSFLRAAELSSVGVRIVFALCGAGLALTAALAVTCFAKLFAMGFLGMSRSPGAERARESSGFALTSMGMLAALCLLLGILPTYVVRGIDRAVQPITASSATAALVPPFFPGAPGHEALPPAFVSEFHDLGAQVGAGLVPGPGLVLLHRGGEANPVVFAAAPSYLVLVLVGLLALTALVVWALAARRRAVVRRVVWDGGIRRLLPEMTYTATGFSNPVRVIFQAIFRPTIVEDTRETVAEHFRTAIIRETEAVHVVDRLVLRPVPRALLAVARAFARLHHGLLNAYVAYALLSLIVVFVVFRLF
jgi:hydrogenase-4 component B